jgi:hypothetical protein
VNVEHQWNDIDRGKPNDSEKYVSQGHFVHHTLHMICPGSEPQASAMGGKQLTACARVFQIFHVLSIVLVLRSTEWIAAPDSCILQ